MNTMKNLNEPHIEDKEIFDSIIKKHNYKNLCKRCSLDKDKCQKSSNVECFIMSNIRDKIFPRYDFYNRNKMRLENITSTNILQDNEIKILKNFYKNNKVFSKVKIDLQENGMVNKGNVCPYCLISESTTFDHYFSESEYPEYILFSPNLIPCCSHCNSKKGALLFKADDHGMHRQFLHFYFDEIPNYQFLKAKFYVEDKIPIVNFELDFEQDREIENIIKSHFEGLDLLNRYRKMSNGIISTTCNLIKEKLKQGKSVEEIQCDLIFYIRNLKISYGNNYWITCIYEAISNNILEVKKLIEID